MLHGMFDSITTMLVVTMFATFKGTHYKYSSNQYACSVGRLRVVPPPPPVQFFHKSPYLRLWYYNTTINLNVFISLLPTYL